MSIITPNGANVFGAPFVEILEYPIDREAAVSVSANLCRRHRLLPIGREGGTLIVAMADPNDILALDDVSAATRLRIRPVSVEAKDLAIAIDRYHRADDELSDLQHELSEQGGTGEDGAAVVEDDEAPIVRFVNLLISQAIQDRASDIHIEPGE
jgi:type IV pilus assembly protein PilB